MKKFIIIVILATLGYFGYKYFNSVHPEIGKIGIDTIGEKIPDNIFSDTSPNDKYLEYLTGEKKVIYFGYADCQIGRQMASNTTSAIQDNNGELAAYYNVKYELFSQGSSVYVGPTNFAQKYLYNKCGSGYACIINPKSKRLLQLDPRADEYKTELNKYKDW